MFAISKAADLNQLVQGGQLYWAFPFSKGSLVWYLRLRLLLQWSTLKYLSSAQCIEILYGCSLRMFVINKLFVPGEPFYPSLMFESQDPGLTSLTKLAEYIRSCLFCCNVSDEEKKSFITLTPDLRRNQVSFDPVWTVVVLVQAEAGTKPESGNPGTILIKLFNTLLAIPAQ
jgi:hypothetical protein